jgi:hypothetical protein
MFSFFHRDRKEDPGKALSPDSSPVTDLGYYFTDWIWESNSTDFMKSMLLFFDGLTLALPADLAAEVVDRDPVLATPLVERGLLVNFDPVATLGADLAEQLAAVLTECVVHLPYKIRWGLHAELGSFHWGGSTNAAVGLERALAQRGLISPAARHGLYNMAPDARLLILVLFAQALRFQLETQGIALHLATDDSEAVDDLTAGLRLYFSTDALITDRSTAGNYYAQFKSLPDVISPYQLNSDLQDVGVDLSAVPLDEVLAFRSENYQHYRAYIKGLRELLTVQTHVDRTERQRLLHERSIEIQDQAAELRRLSRKAFGARMATLLVSISGSAWTLRTGDPIGAMLAGAAAGLQAVPVEGETVTAYSYLIKARDLGDR